jgi:dihydrofolate reductase
MTTTLVAAIAANGVIGRDGSLPWPRTGDLAEFKRLTMGHVLVMGRRTYESIGRALPGRTTIVVTAQPDWAADGVFVAGSVDGAIATARSLDDDVFVVGGAAVYAEAMPMADRMVLTHIDASYDGDRWFPAVDWAAWREVSRDEHDGFVICTYVRA